MEEQVVALLKQDVSGLKAKEIAEKLGTDTRTIHTLLYGKLKHTCQQDNRYRWFLKENYSFRNQIIQRAKTQLAKFSYYYLSCLRTSEVEISTFAQSKYNDEDYVELRTLEIDSTASDFFLRLKRKKERQRAYLGYPTNLKKIKSQKNNWEAYVVEPLFLIPLEEDGSVNIHSHLIINFSPLKKYTHANYHHQLMEEVFQLEEELGLNESEEAIELEEVVRRLAHIRPQWLWQEDINPEQISSNPSLKDIRKEGIYNRAICISHEGSPFTRGLEIELQKLSQLDEGEYEQSVLGKWVNGHKENNENTEISLLEVLPMNLEQSDAVKSALTSDLTVITGPPGTGKSQVVTNLLINAVWYGKKVLFASKNNKAVDVVEVRANNLGPHSFLLRTGSFKYSNKILEYLITVLSDKITPKDENDYNFCKNEYSTLQKELENLNREEERFIELRNTLDALSQDFEIIRENIDINTIKEISFHSLKEQYFLSQSLFDKCSRNNHNFIIRLLWRFVKDKYCSTFLSEGENLFHITKDLPLKRVEVNSGENLIGQWKVFLEALGVFLDYIDKANKYFFALNELDKAKSLESIAREKFHVINNMSHCASNLWQKWLKLKPQTLSNEDKKKISQYRSLYEMIKNSHNQYDKEIYKQFLHTSEKTSHLFSAWAITCLSAHDRIPFYENFFDIVIFDEASQCDIASALPLLYRAKSAVIIGDTKQLSHISSLNPSQDKLLLQKYRLLENHSQWAYSYNSLFDLAVSFTNQNNIIKLRDHHRSHRDIIEFSNKHFYGEELRIATNYDKLNPPNPRDIGIKWKEQLGKVTKPPIGGAENSIEAGAVVEEIRKLLKRGYTGSIGVVTPFRAQANLIRQLVYRDKALCTELSKNEFLVDTVHTFQGDERDLMLFSPVVSRGISRSSLNFLSKSGNLFNVAITRARALLLVVGDSNFISQSDVTYLKEFATYSQDIRKEKEKEIIQSIDYLTENYPVVSNPEKVSEWEHILYKALYKKGIKAIPQYNVDKYTLDFALFDETDKERQLNIEVDGERYHKNWTGELCRRDQIRNHRLIELGWDIKRFWVYQIRDELQKCVKIIQAWLGV